MINNHFTRWSILLLIMMLVACTSKTPTLAPAPTTELVPLPDSTSPALPTVESRLPTPTPAPFAASVMINTFVEQVQVGQPLNVNVTVQNEEQASIGRPLFTLHINQAETQPIFEPVAPDPIEFLVGLEQGDSWTTDFTLQAVRPGRVIIWATVGVEVQQGIPDPVFWTEIDSDRVEVTVVTP